MSPLQQKLKEHKEKLSIIQTEIASRRIDLPLKEETKLKISNTLKEGYAEGRILIRDIPTKGIPMRYKGVYIRSTWEYSFIKQFEALGYEFKKDFIYEPVDFRVPYVDDNGENHTYFPDFYFFKENIVYEIKPERLSTHSLNHTKIEAAKKYFEEKNIGFELFTENQINLIPIEAISNDPDIIFAA